MNQSQYFMNQSQDLTQFQMLNSSQLISEMNLLSQMHNPMAIEAPMMMIPHGYTYFPLYTPPVNNLNFSNQINPNNGGADPGRSNWKAKNAMKKKQKDVKLPIPKEVEQTNQKAMKKKQKDVKLPNPKEIEQTNQKAMKKKQKDVKLPSPKEVEQKNQLKSKKVRNKKLNRMVPYPDAPRNTTTYLIRAKKEGGIGSLVSPCPVTPAVLPTPVFSPLREALVDMAKKEWGVNGYGSMNGLIRLRSSSVQDGDQDDGDSGEVTDVEMHPNLSRFEMVSPNNVVGNRVDDQEMQISQLEEDTVLLKEKLYLMEKDLGEMKRRMQCLESKSQNVQKIYDGLVGNVCENA